MPGWDFGETTIGLRNLTGTVNANGTVTLWATTGTTSGSGDNGADPNEIVKITDVLGDTALPTSEAFSVFDGPVAGLRYGGVAFAATPEPSTWAMLLLGFAGIGFAGYRNRSALSVRYSAGRRAWLAGSPPNPSPGRGRDALTPRRCR